MEISVVEKLLLLILCDLAKKQKIKSDFDCEFIENAISSGNTWAIEQEYSGLLSKSEVKRNVVDFTKNILEMCDDIKRSYKSLPTKDKEYVKNTVANFDENFVFKGFGGNTECDYMGVAGFLIQKMHKFQSLKDCKLNSHVPMVENYKQMYTIYKPLTSKISLSKDDIVKILKNKN
ncbi:YfbU family protein [Pectinatus frisingensis]|uniref:YfbU family protein n=1 Tax=Pectinatus frisingensis TaxID=865 RepID=UPI0018C61380|nr:YfbU family protein [Pectinatus frisingensis]